MIGRKGIAIYEEGQEYCQEELRTKQTLEQGKTGMPTKQHIAEPKRTMTLSKMQEAML